MNIPYISELQLNLFHSLCQEYAKLDRLDIKDYLVKNHKDEYIRLAKRLFNVCLFDESYKVFDYLRSLELLDEKNMLLCELAGNIKTWKKESFNSILIEKEKKIVELYTHLKSTQENEYVDNLDAFGFNKPTKLILTFLQKENTSTGVDYVKNDLININKDDLPFIVLSILREIQFDISFIEREFIALLRKEEGITEDDLGNITKLKYDNDVTNEYLKLLGTLAFKEWKNRLGNNWSKCISKINILKIRANTSLYKVTDNLTKQNKSSLETNKVPVKILSFEEHIYSVINLISPYKLEKELSYFIIPKLLEYYIKLGDLSVTKRYYQNHQQFLKELKKIRKIKIFISYSRLDKKWMSKIKYALEEEGFTVIVDEYDFVYGENIQSAIVKKIKETDFTLCLISKNSLLSSWVGFEIVETILHQKYGEDVMENKFFPIIIEKEILGDSYFSSIKKTLEKQYNKVSSQSQELDRSLDENPILEEKKKRLKVIRKNLGQIFQALKSKKNIVLEDVGFQQAMQEIIKNIKDSQKNL